MILYFFRLGLPLGSALITLTFIDTIIGFFWVLLHYCNYINAVFQDPQEIVERGYYANLQWSFFISLRAMLAILLWVGVVCMGKKRVLIFWLVISIVDDLAILGNLVNDQLQYEKKFSTEVSWIFNVIVFVIFRLYLSFIAVQSLWYLEKDNESSDESFTENEADSTKPLGQGLCQIWDFYKDFPSGAVTILITSEMMWNVFNLTTRGLTKVLFGLDLFIVTSGNPQTYIALEETIIRCIRIFLGACALVFVKKIKPTLMRIWICAYLIVLFASLVIFIGVVRIWENPTFYRIFFYSIYIFMDNIFRSLILYFSVKFTICHILYLESAPEIYYL